ncbi:lysophospholipid acyltransferase family protein [Massilia glaciei]|uniref:1-acyl-sn-glycerol-3-phosphate acyltransferase n=1 Tax=Massilia glaciei TaxID=1524097 RepID=A0A2U2HE48_9BURK|nr:lysophospholipid acyltransferase family protein [Massilia glaciei]PWF41545.1 1-acyl-sn-glycerol-3-phosphate acyltransferase [Massilia glaciei]
MIELAGRGWRVFATGLSFALFGLAGMLLGLVVLPLLSLGVRGRERRSATTRTVIRHTFRLFVATMRALGVLRYRLSGFERLEREGMLILANHPTLIDTVFLMAFVKRADCIIKGALWQNFFMGRVLRAAGYINNDQGPQLVEACIASLRAGNNLIIFPEGTRTPAGGALAFLRGAANIAVRGARPITPAVIRCEPPALGKEGRWWRVPPRRVMFTIDVHEDIAAHQFRGAGQSDVMAARHLTQQLQEYFTKESQRYA